jgi:serine protease Do
MPMYFKRSNQMRNWRGTLISVSLWAVTIGVGYFGYAHFQTSQFARAEDGREEVRRGLGHLEDLAAGFRNVSRVVEPSVVNIAVRKKGPSVRRPKLDEDFFRRFFPDRDGDGEPDLPPGALPHGIDPEEEDFLPEQVGTGSGVIIDVEGRRGYIITNNHVAGGAEEIIVTLNDGREIKNGRLLGADPKTDLAVIVIEADRLSSSQWGDSDELQKGDWVLAFGSPFGYVGSMTHGIVSALNRQAGILGQYGYENFIQVDAPINPGNSGGPLVNLKGQIVGINTAIASRSGGFQGIGFTIPSNQARFIYRSLKDSGKVVRGWLGVAIADVASERETAGSLGFPGDAGVLVQDVIPGTPAMGRLLHGDIITEIDGRTINTMQALRGMIAQIPPGTDVRFKVFRKGSNQEVMIALGEQPDDLSLARARVGPGPAPAAPAAPAAVETLGLRVQTLTPDIADKRMPDLKAGVRVSRVERNSPAARAGIRIGDVITEVGQTRVATAEEFDEAMKGVDLAKGVRLYVTTPQGSRFVFVSIDRR